VKNFKDFSSDNLVLRKNLQVKILISVTIAVMSVSKYFHH
jgi:hypothetical protein